MQQHACAVYVDPLEVDARLAKLGLTQAVLIEAVLAAQGAAAGTTRHHPKGHAGYVMWSEGMKELRDLLAMEKWEIDDVQGQPLVISPDGKIAITASGGNEITGVPGRRHPKTRSLKGSATLNAALSNTGYLFPEIELEELVRINALNKRETWILLLFRDKTARETRSELSRPIWRGHVARKSQVVEWSDRIILPKVPFGDDPAATRLRPDVDGGLSGKVQVDVRRKA